MKKNTVYFAMTMLLALTLCGCGNDMTGVTDTPKATATTAATASPMITTDVEDGVVDDKDGVIGNENANGGGSGTGSGSSNAGSGNNTSAASSPSTSTTGNS